MPDERTRVRVRVRRPWWRRHLFEVVALAAGVLVLAAFLGAILTGAQDHPSPPTAEPSTRAAPSEHSNGPTEESSSGLSDEMVLLLGEPRMWDDFARDDSAGDIDRQTAPSGHLYMTTHSEGSQLDVKGHRLVPAGVGPGARTAILYTEVDGVEAIGLEWVWTPGPEGHENIVIGATTNGFGRGSVQVTVYEDEWPDHPGLRWALFYVPQPIIDPYPVIASGGLPDFVADGQTEYRVVLRRTASDQVLVSLPDGTTAKATDPAIAAYWGNRVGWQLRRPLAGDGAAEFTAVAAS
jgi:hypothetical protein